MNPKGPLEVSTNFGIDSKFLQDSRPFLGQLIVKEHGTVHHIAGVHVHWCRGAREREKVMGVEYVGETLAAEVFATFSVGQKRKSERWSVRT